MRRQLVNTAEQRKHTEDMAAGAMRFVVLLVDRFAVSGIQPRHSYFVSNVYCSLSSSLVGTRACLWMP